MSNIFDYDQKNPEDIELHAKKLIGKTFRDVLRDANVASDIEEVYMNKGRKGKLGNLIEEYHFGYRINSDSRPDFDEAGVELKVSPYEMKKNGELIAGERIVISMINYNGPLEIDFYKSSLWDKCNLTLFIYYLRNRMIDALDYSIDYAKLFQLQGEDLEIIAQDYRTIVGKVIAGKAHELSEGDTMYLGACTKGATAAKSLVSQYYNPDVKAKKRAFSFKQSYMSYVLNHYISKEKTTYERIIKDETALKERTFEEIIVNRISEYVGKSDLEIAKLFNIDAKKSGKSLWITLAFQMLGIKSNKAEEFEKANIVVKAIRLEENGTMKESSSLPHISFQKLVDEEWDNSNLLRYFEETKFFFVVFKKVNNQYILKGSQLWNMPAEHIQNEVRDGWTKIQNIFKEGIKLTISGNTVQNNLPKKNDNPIIHIRPHASLSYYQFYDGSTFGSGSVRDADELPDGRWMTKQSFWLNNTYILSVLDEKLKS